MKQKMLPSRPEMLQAFLAQDKSFDGLFVAGVTSTLIFCRPSCPARKPKPENVEFFYSAADALFAGFRPCKRCGPTSEGATVPDWAPRLLAQIDAQPSERIRDQNLREQGLDPVAVRRFFLKSYGVTFQAFCRARRLGAAFSNLTQGGSIDDAVFDHGWESHSGFREAFGKVIGQTPGSVRDQDHIRITRISSPLGQLVAGATSTGLCLLEFTERRMLETQMAVLKRRFNLPVVPGDSSFFDSLHRQLSEYFQGTRKEFDLPLVYPGTEFQTRVWDGLRRIPYGQTWSYAKLARQVGAEGGARAVGHANGLNRIAILIPCHRVVNANGDLGGYGGGLWRKLRLLEIEGAPFNRQDLLPGHCQIPPLQPPQS